MWECKKKKSKNRECHLSKFILLQSNMLVYGTKQFNLVYLNVTFYNSGRKYKTSTLFKAIQIHTYQR